MDGKDKGIIECLWQKLNSFVLGKGNEQHIFTSWIRGDGSGIHVAILKISCLKRDSDSHQNKMDPRN